MMRQGHGVAGAEQGSWLDIYHRIAQLWQALRISSDLERTCSEFGTTGHGYCVVGTRICHEMWVADFAWVGREFLVRLGSRILWGFVAKRRVVARFFVWG